MSAPKAIVITGARGNLGSKLAQALRGSYDLRCLDLLRDDGCQAADIGSYDAAWTRHFVGADTVLHFAGESQPTAPWALVHRANILGLANVLRASRAGGIRRIIFASSNQIMAGYRFARETVTPTMPPAPLNPYAISKLIGEEMGRAFAADTGISFIAFRIGNILPGENRPHPNMGIGLWGQQMWLSNRDFIDGVRAAISTPNVPFAILNLVSNNPGMHWDLAETDRVLGFRPKDGFTPCLSPEDVAEDEVARKACLVPGLWLDQRFRALRG